MVERQRSRSPRVSPGRDISQAETVSAALVFIKPHAVTEHVKEFVEKRFADAGVKIISKGAISAEKIDKDMLIDTHYGAIASRAMRQKPAELTVQQKAQEDFQKVFGMPWSAALQQGLVYNLVDSATKLGCTYGDIGAKWLLLKKDQDLLKFGGGFYCGKIGDIFIINGFYAKMRSGYTVPGECIYFYEVQWETAKMPWTTFRSNLLGATDPAVADTNSMRHHIYKNWKDLGLAAEPNTSNNGLHASASPFEALAERSNWLGVKLEDDFFCKAMMAVGVPLESIKLWCGDPAVFFTGKKQSLFDLLEDIDGADCLKKSVEIHEENQQEQEVKKRPAASTQELTEVPVRFVRQDGKTGEEWQGRLNKDGDAKVRKAFCEGDPNLYDMPLGKAITSMPQNGFIDCVLGTSKGGDVIEFVEVEGAAMSEEQAMTGDEQRVYFRMTHDGKSEHVVVRYLDRSD